MRRKRTPSGPFRSESDPGAKSADRAAAPLLGAAAGLSLGAALGLLVRLPSVPLAVLGIALCIAAGPHRCRWLAWILAGWILLHAAASPWREVQQKLRWHRPVTLEGAIVGCWQEGHGSWRADFEIARVRQGPTAWPVSRRIRLYAAHGPAEVACGGAYRVRGYLNPPRWYANDPRVAVGEWSLFLKSTRLIERIEDPGAWAVASAALRRRARRDRGSWGPGARLAWALTTGETGRLDPGWILALRRWGLAHLVAVSGLHLGLLAALVAVAACAAPGGVRGLSVLFAAALYLLLAGPRLSLLRAGLMLVLGVAALTFRRPPSPGNGLGLAVLTLLAWDPASIGSISFQLSAAATAGILLLGPGLADVLGRRRIPFAGALSVTLGAQIATLPWALAVFHRWSPWAPVANLLAAPWAVASLAVSFLRCASAVVFAEATPPTDELLDLLTRPLEMAAALPPTRWGSPPIGLDSGTALGVSALWMGGLGLGLGLLRCPVNPRPLVTALMVSALWLPIATACAEEPFSGPELVMLDVGQGDGILLRDGEDALLVDAGGWDREGFGARVVLPALARGGLHAPRRMAISHGDRDHCGGILDLAREVPTEAILLPASAAESACGRELISLPWVESRLLEAGEILAVGRWRLWVLGPPPDHSGSGNGGSLVLRAETAGRCVLLTGDLDGRGERRLLSRWPHEVLRCDLLKVAHHGSRSSTTTGFLNVVRPRRALISAGRDNAYGHPATEILNRLKRRRIQILRTDRHGMIRVGFPSPGSTWIRTAVGEGS